MPKTGADEIEDDDVASPSSASIIRLPSFKTIPEPDLPLSPLALKIYNERCRELLEMGMLTSRSRDIVETLALTKGEIAVAMSKGKAPSGRLYESLRTANLQLNKLDADKTLGEASGNGNEYAHFGFARRERKKRFGK